MDKILDAVVEVIPVTVAKLEMKPGDTLVIRMDMGPIIAQQELDRFQDMMRPLLPEGCKAVIMPKDAELTVIPKESTP